VNDLRIYAYDGNGNVTRYEVDWDADGTVDWIQTLTFDANGNLTHFVTDRDGDGLANEIVAITNDNSGNMIKADVTGDRAQFQYLTYDAYGNLTRDGRDYNGDGVEDTVQAYTYDANDNLIDTLYLCPSGYFGRENEFAENYIYDAEGQMLRSELDSNNDGSTDRIATFFYDPSGRLLRTMYDLNADGTADLQYARAEYDIAGNRTWYEYDYDLNGTVESDISVYDTEGDLLRMENFDGTSSQSSTMSYEAANTFSQWNYLHELPPLLY